VRVPTPAFEDDCGLAPEGIYPGVPTPLSNDWTGTPDASDIYSVGITQVTWTVFDANGNSTSCAIDVQVIQGQDPNITLTSQAEVNDFVANYDGSPIAGSLIISGADITDLSGLANITSIGGDLRIEANPILTNIDGLQNITSIGGSLFLLNNPALTNVDGLQDLNTLGGNRLFLLNNPLLTNIDGLQNLSSVGEFLRITIFNNDALTNVDGLQNIQEIGGALTIQFNAALTNIDGLQNVQNNRSFFRIEYNDVLGEFCGVFGLASTGSAGQIYGNAENPTLEDIGSGEACGRILPAPELPALPWPYLVLFGLILLGVARIGIRYLD
jgi:hypothetical protein